MKNAYRTLSALFQKQSTIYRKHPSHTQLYSAVNHSKMKTTLVLPLIIAFVSCHRENSTDSYIGDHVAVRKSIYFPYTVAILKKGQYISAGALIHESWVLTAADALFLLQESIRLLQVRVGTINYKKGGISVPCKYFEIHPLFDDRKPQYDIALIRLSNTIKINPSRKPIRLEKKPKRNIEHFTLTAWSMFDTPRKSTFKKVAPIEEIKQRRTLTVSHLHPSDEEECTDFLGAFGHNDTKTIMCLDPAKKFDEQCSREVGAPVVYNGVLRGVVSSWKPDDCGPLKNLVIVNIVTIPTTRSWIHSIVHEKKKRDSFDDDQENGKEE